MKGRREKLTVAEKSSDWMNDGDVDIQETQLGLRRVRSKVPWPPLMALDDKDREETLKAVRENNTACSRKPSKCNS